MSNKNPHCKCTPEKFPFKCERHCVTKGQGQFNHCQLNTSNGIKYWNAWEHGIDHLQDCSPDDPKPNTIKNRTQLTPSQKKKQKTPPKRKYTPRKISWTYGVTSVSDRVDTLLPATLASLVSAGFPEPTLFIDNFTMAQSLALQKKIGLPVVCRSPRIKTYGNWILTLWELYLRNPNVDRYVIFQDDFIAYKNLRLYLEKVPYPEKGYWNLYTFPSNEKLAPKNHTGFYESNQLGKGAVALVFDNKTVTTLLQSENIILKPKAAKKSTKSVDGAIIQALRTQGFKEYVHFPSLTQHTGIQSSMGNNKHPLPKSFKGEDFDALNLLAKPKSKKGLGDKVEAALTSVGITSERIHDWLGIPCNCTERKKKLNQLGAWASQILTGKKEKGKQHLEEIVGVELDTIKPEPIEKPFNEPDGVVRDLTYFCDVVIPYCEPNLQWLKSSVDSILNQVGAMCVVHLVSDGVQVDKDPALDYKDHPQVRLYSNEKSIGPYRTLNRIFDRLETDYIAIQDSDDIALPHRIKHSIESLRENDCEIYGGAMQQFVPYDAKDSESQQRLQDNPYHYSGHNKWRLCPNGNIINGTLVLKKKTYKELNGFVALMGSADLEFATRAHRANRNIFTDEEVVGLRRLHNKSLSHGKTHGVDTDSRNKAHKTIERIYEQMVPGCDFTQFGSLNIDRKLSHLTQPVNDLIRLDNLEIHVAHACNLSCEQCSHYSNFKHAGLLSPEEADREMGLWSNRLFPKYFSLLGGEPTLNPDLIEILILARKHFPHSVLQLVTNGFRLHKHPQLPVWLEKLNVHLEISDHHESKEYQQKLEPVRQLVTQWHKDYTLQINWRKSSSRWKRSYKGHGKTMQPYTDKDPQSSWNNCSSKWCPQLFNGKLYKCPQMAYLKTQLEKVGLENNKEWEEYLQYSPLDSNCTNTVLKEFVERKVESCCNMCPANPERFMLPLPLRSQ